MKVFYFDFIIMDYEKEYNEALERAKELLDSPRTCFDIVQLKNIFPKLRESENERVRMTLIKMISDIDGGYPFEKYGITKKDALNWFEKQKEQKPDIEHIQQSWYMEGYKDREHNREPKWIIKTGEEGPKYELNPKYGQDLIKEQKFWTFNEPYDPDECEVVMEGNAISLKRKGQKSVDYDHEMWKNCEANFEGGKKEVIEHPEKYGLQKPAEWSEEDERYINGLIGLIEDMKVGISPKLRGIAADRCIAFLKSLRTSWKPSEVEYVRKDLLLKWANIELERRRNTGDDYFYPAIVVLGDLIDKLYTL